jgi:hypothetical protein
MYYILHGAVPMVLHDHVLLFSAARGEPEAGDRPAEPADLPHPAGVSCWLCKLIGTQRPRLAQPSSTICLAAPERSLLLPAAAASAVRGVIVSNP